MRVTCKYTGLTFTSSSFSKVRFVGEHPLMTAPLETLLSRTANWSKGELSPVEQYILFIALLKSTDLVDFQVAVKAKRNIIVANMEKLIKAAGWISFMRSKTYLPRYVVTEETCNLSNIHFWLDSLEEAKVEFHSNYWTSSARDRLEHRTAALERMIKSPQRNALRYATILAEWALTASAADTKLDKEMLEKWKAIFRLRGNDIALVSLDDIDDVLDYMTINLPSYKAGIFATETLLHLRKLRSMKETGDFLGILDYDQLTYDPKDVLDNPFKIIPSDSQAHQFIKNVAINAPTELPKRSDYSTNVEYIRAYAQYNVAKTAKRQIMNQIASATQIPAAPEQEITTDENHDI